jgi:hypothetical protein
VLGTCDKEKIQHTHFFFGDLVSSCKMLMLTQNFDGDRSMFSHFFSVVTLKKKGLGNGLIMI